MVQALHWAVKTHEQQYSPCFIVVHSPVDIQLSKNNQYDVTNFSESNTMQHTEGGTPNPAFWDEGVR